MRNVTISLEDDVARWARVWAAEQDTSLSRLISELLKARMEAEQGYALAKQDFLSRGAVKLRQDGAEPYPDRASLHER